MTEFAGNVQQQSDTITADNRTRTVALDREGALFGGSNEEKYRQWLAAGKVFAVGGGDGGMGAPASSTIENNTAIDLTEPFFVMDIPSSIVVVPILIKITPAVVWETADEIVVYASNAAGYASGGDDLSATIENMAVPGASDSELGTTAITTIRDGDAALTMAAVSDARILDFTNRLTGDLHSPYEYNILKGSPLTMIHGVASLAVMVARTTSTVEVHYQVVWAELDKNSLVNS